MKKILVFVLIFLAGFLTHAFIFPDFLSYSFNLAPLTSAVLPNKNNESGTQNPNDIFKTKVQFANSKFTPQKTWVRQGNYFDITNKDPQQLMMLISDNKQFTTPRAYGLSEQIIVYPNKKGTFYVYEKTSGAKLTIIVN